MTEDIYDLLESEFGIYKETNRPDEIRFCCPYCPDGDFGYHLYVNIDNYLYHCFRCQEKGHLSRLFKRKLPRRPRKKKKREYEALLPVDSFEPIVGSTSQLAQWCREYMESRGITDMTDIWYGVKDEWIGRVVFPVFEFGKIVMATGRSIIGEEPKYLNAIGSRKSTFIYRLDRVVHSPYIVITEGCIDALSAPNTVALMGKELSPTQEAKLKRVVSPEKPVYIALDYPDAIPETIDIANRLRWVYDKLFICRLPEEQDLNSIQGRWQDYPVVEVTPTNLIKYKLRRI